MPTSPASPYQARLKKLQAVIGENSLPPLLLSRPADITYYTGFQFLLSEEREAFLLVSEFEAKLWYASFSPLPAKRGYEAIPMRGVTEVAQQLQDLAFTHLALDPGSLTLTEYRTLTQAHIKSMDLDRAHIWRQRMIKDEEEQRHIIRASQITLAAFTAVFPLIQPGITEQTVAALLDAEMRQHHAEPAFPTIVAFGPHSALPHHQPTHTQLQPETAVLIDFGSKYQSYCSDFTRSWWFGTQPPALYRTVQSAVQHAYQAGIDALTQPLTAQQLDGVVRSDLHHAGYGHAFIHTTGHGLGIEIHEPPSLSANNPQTLQPGMAITVEPGVYLEGEFGYRFENTALVTTSKPIITTYLDDNFLPTH